MWRHVQWILPALASTAFAFWLAQLAGLSVGLGLVIGIALSILSGIATAALAKRDPSSTPELCWDGASWTSNGQPVQPQVMIDSGGSWMLLRLHPQALPGQEQRDRAAALQRGRSGVAVSKSDCGADWHSWRAAVYCPPPDPTALGGARQSP
jgi:hypothetical protein